MLEYIFSLHNIINRYFIFLGSPSVSVCLKKSVVVQTLVDGAVPSWTVLCPRGRCCALVDGAVGPQLCVAKPCCKVALLLETTEYDCIEYLGFNTPAHLNSA